MKKFLVIKALIIIYWLLHNLDLVLLYGLLFVLAAIAFAFWKPRRRISVSAIVALVVISLGRVWYLHFDSRRWLASSENERYPMVNDLVSQHILVGKTRDEITLLLGRPHEFPYPMDPARSEYAVWQDKTKFGEPKFCYLEISFDQGHRATSAKLFERNVEIPSLP